MKLKPVASGLMPCEQAVIEERTRNVSLVNCFRRRAVERFPSEIVPFVVFALLTDGLADISLGVSIRRLDTLDEIYWQPISFRFTSPLQEVQLLLRVRDCSFPVAGVYQVTLLGEGEPLAQRRIHISQKEKRT
jgi:hypothetical protein